MTFSMAAGAIAITPVMAATITPTATVGMTAALIMAGVDGKIIGVGGKTTGMTGATAGIRAPRAAQTEIAERMAAPPLARMIGIAPLAASHPAANPIDGRAIAQIAAPPHPLGAIAKMTGIAPHPGAAIAGTNQRSRLVPPEMPKIAGNPGVRLQPPGLQRPDPLRIAGKEDSLHFRPRNPRRIAGMRPVVRVLRRRENRRITGMRPVARVLRRRGNRRIAGMRPDRAIAPLAALPVIPTAVRPLKMSLAMAAAAVAIGMTTMMTGCKPWLYRTRAWLYPLSWVALRG